MPEAFDLTSTILRVQSAIKPFRALVELSDVLEAFRTQEAELNAILAATEKAQGERITAEAELAAIRHGIEDAKANLATVISSTERQIAETHAKLDSDIELAAAALASAQKASEDQILAAKAAAEDELSAIKADINAALQAKADILTSISIAQKTLDDLNAAIARITGK